MIPYRALSAVAIVALRPLASRSPLVSRRLHVVIAAWQRYSQGGRRTVIRHGNDAAIGNRQPHGQRSEHGEIEGREGDSDDDQRCVNFA
jgi:hypothetical protein